MTDDDTYRLWDGWLEKIRTEATDLLVLRHIYRGVGKLVLENPRAQKPSSFYEWMARTYVATASMAIHRQLDVRSDSVSMMRLLTEIERRPEVFSRVRYRSLWPADIYSSPSLADGEFDRWAGSGKDFIDSSFVWSDIESLRASTPAVVKKYADKKFAHTDQRGPIQVPKFDDLDRCVDLLEELAKKYLHIFRAQSFELLPVWQYDWTQIFREPWIPATR